MCGTEQTVFYCDYCKKRIEPEQVAHATFRLPEIKWHHVDCWRLKEEGNVLNIDFPPA